MSFRLLLKIISKKAKDPVSSKISMELLLSHIRLMGESRDLKNVMVNNHKPTLTQLKQTVKPLINAA